MKYGNEIVRLHGEGKTRSEIKKILGCSKSTVKFHLSEGEKERGKLRMRKHRANLHPLMIKFEKFISRTYNKNKNVRTPKVDKAIYDKLSIFYRYRKSSIMNNDKINKIKVEDLFEIFGPNPTCYLTGQPIDLNKPSTYQLDHIIPVSRGGDNSLENMGLCISEANYAKGNMLLDEFKALCQKVVNHTNN